jgi:hypothetical protein
MPTTRTPFAWPRSEKSLFENMNGHPAHTIEELERWTGSIEGRKYLATFCDARGHIIPD